MDINQRRVLLAVLGALTWTVPVSVAAQSLNLPRAMPAAAEIVLEELPPEDAAPILLDPGGNTIYVDEGPMLQTRGGPVPYQAPWSWQMLPEGLIYRSYLAGAKEPRLSSVLFHERDDGWLWEGTIGARVGVIRYGTPAVDKPEGWQLDVEAAAFPRLDPDEEMDLRSSDFRGGTVLTRGEGRNQIKFGYYHLSSHVGDEFLLKNEDFERINYSRDAIILGHSFFPTADLRLYAETAWAFQNAGGSEPWEFQVGADYSPAHVTGFRGAPFLALNGHLREEHDFGGNFVLQTGWQWRGPGPGRLLRTGLHYYNGKSPQFSFFDEFEEQLGVGLWYDF